MPLLGDRLRRLFKNPLNDKQVAEAVSTDHFYDRLIVVELESGEKVRLVPSSLYDENFNYDQAATKDSAVGAAVRTKK
jgi:hypothetical protein